MAQSSNTGLKQVAITYAKLLKLKATPASIQKSLEENPYYPSLLSLSDTFSKFGVDNNAYNVSAEFIDQLEPPFVVYAYVPGIGNDFVVITDLRNNAVSYIHKNTKGKTVSKEEFLENYQKIVWLAEVNEKSGDPDFEKHVKEAKKKRNRRVIWVAGMVLLVLLAFSINITALDAFAFSIISLIKIMGLATAVLLLVHEIDKDNAFVKNICNISSRSNCDVILGSKASKILGISWSQIGFIYFSATTLWLLLPGISFSNKAIWLSIANALAAPYILFSLYYQWRVAKQWCTLCLIIQALLFAELIWALVFSWSHPFIFQFSPHDLTLIAICILLPILAWYGLLPLFNKAKEHSLYVSAYRRLQYNPDIFTGLLQQQAKAADDWQQLGITLGNPDATTTILKVCNPYCGPCAKAHTELEEIIHRNRNVNLKIIFNVRNQEYDRTGITVRHLLAVASGDDASKTQRALDDWYLAEKKDYELFSAKYPMNGELKQQDVKIDAMIKWCKESDISYTPTIFINGYRIPENYNIKELSTVLLSDSGFNPQ